MRKAICTPERTAEQLNAFYLLRFVWSGLFSWLFYVNANNIGVLGFNSQIKFKENAYTIRVAVSWFEMCVWSTQYSSRYTELNDKSNWVAESCSYMNTGFTKLINNIWFTQTETSSNVGNHNFTIATTISIDKIILLNLPITYLGRH